MPLISLMSSFNVAANASAAKKKVVKVEKVKSRVMKCHVELLGGGETIHFINTTKFSSRQLAQTLVGLKISTSKVKAKQEIYKLNKCIKLDETFKTAKAKLLDKNTVR